MAAADDLVALAGGRSYHRAGCRLVEGKAAAEPVDVALVAERELSPCRLCDPPGLQVA